MSDFDKYNTKVGREQGGNRFFVKEDGIMNFFEEDFTGAALRLQLLGGLTVTQHTQSGDALAGSTLQTLTPGYGTHVFSAATTMSKGSTGLPAPLKGALLFLNGNKLVTDGNMSIILGSAGLSLVNEGSVALSSFEISALGFADMVCHTAGLWSIVDANILEHAE